MGKAKTKLKKVYCAYCGFKLSVDNKCLNELCAKTDSLNEVPYDESNSEWLRNAVYKGG